jgi:hypothetical protein
MYPVCAPFDPNDPNTAVAVPNGEPGDAVDAVPRGTATLDAYCVPVPVADAIEYAVCEVPKTVKDAVFAEDAAGVNCQNLILDTVYATELVQ